MRRVKIWQVDAFTNQPFGGNPAAVCLMESDAPADWMQAVAAEMNLAETAFVTRQDDGFGLRWFAPRAEVPLCGHATLASAHVLWSAEIAPHDQSIRFATLSGPLICHHRGDEIEMDFPATPAEPSEPPPDLFASLGVASERVRFVGKTTFDYLVELENEQAVRAVRPDFERLKGVPTRGVIITSKADGETHDIVSRFFCPALGIDEDPVTGSAHCCLGPYWTERLGRSPIRAYQASPRGGHLKVQVESERVQLSGQAVTVLEGELRT